MSSFYTNFNIHGDNIVECERTLLLIESGLSDRGAVTEGPLNSSVCPRFQIHLPDHQEPLEFTFYPGFSRWNQDILDLVRSRGGVLREAADAIITGVISDREEPLLAIEYCGALPAGNQAWQRNGRAYSFGLAGIPYLYIAELGGFELDTERQRKSSRLPNPAVPFSYLSFSVFQKTPTLQVFMLNPGAGHESKQEYKSVLADSKLNQLIRALILNENAGPLFENLKENVFSFVKLRAASLRAGNSLTPAQWDQVYDVVKSGQSLVPCLIKNAPISWSKTAYIEALTNTAKQLMETASQFAIGLTSRDLPMCIIPPAKRLEFAERLLTLYPTLGNDFVTWLKQAKALVICWVMGFKPRGDDARPDRGLPPLTRMLIGEQVNLLTVVYGPAPSDMWSQFLTDPAALMERNGLWEAILEVSDAVLIDSETDNVTNHGFLRKHWEIAIPKSKPISILVEPRPLRIGENDVDTVLHCLFARLSGGLVFEGMCNPPGGDWSGLSIQDASRSKEFRWLSLRRVSGKHSKRPDHVFEVFPASGVPIILAVESKESPRSVETKIGPRLKAYIEELLDSSPSVQRQSAVGEWTHSKSKLSRGDFLLVSAVAFIPRNEMDILDVRSRAEADLVIAFYFSSDGTSCEVRFIPCSDTGRTVVANIKEFQPRGPGISVRYDQ